MENQDKIYSQFKNAAHNSTVNEVPNSETIWNRIEEKMDKKVLKKQNKLWKKIAVAASILLVFSVVFQFLKSNKIDINSPNTVVVKDTLISTKNNCIATDTKTVIDSFKIVSSEKAIKIIQNEIKLNNKVAVQETAAIEKTTILDNSNQRQLSTWSNQQEELFKEKEVEKVIRNKNYDAISVKKVSEEIVAPTEYTKKQEVPVVTKNDPLLVINNKAIVTKNGTNYDKLTKDELAKINKGDIETLVYLKEPLYIIDGKQYSEEELFGKKPTSPYAPLSEQEIISTKVLQGEEAIAAYGEKGEKGVLIITTKNGKPVKKVKKVK